MWIESDGHGNVSTIKTLTLYVWLKIARLSSKNNPLSLEVGLSHADSLSEHFRGSWASFSLLLQDSRLSQVTEIHQNLFDIAFLINH